MSAAKPSKATISNALAAAWAANLKPTSIRISPDGSFTIDVVAIGLELPANNVAAASQEKAPKKWKNAK
jgi:hypothetical protein